MPAAIGGGAIVHYLKHHCGEKLITWRPCANRQTITLCLMLQRRRIPIWSNPRCSRTSLLAVLDHTAPMGGRKLRSWICSHCATVNWNRRQQMIADLLHESDFARSLRHRSNRFAISSAPPGGFRRLPAMRGTWLRPCAPADSRIKTELAKLTER